jgi:hypothetical protein
VLHYRLENRATPSTPEPAASAPMPEPSAQSAPVLVRQPTPAPLYYNDGNSYPCEYCGNLTVKKVQNLIPMRDIYADNNKPCHVSMCNVQCWRDYQSWCMSLLPGLNSRPKGLPSNMIHIAFNGIKVPQNGDALHDEWRVQFVLVKEGRRTGMVVTPEEDESVEVYGAIVTPCIFMSLNRLKKWCLRTPQPSEHHCL